MPVIQRYPLPPTNEFCIDFRTTPDGYIIATQVTIKEVVMDAADHARVDLADHPFYKKLQRYVLDNPRQA